MIDKSPPARTLERKKREAEALKANIKKRKLDTKARDGSMATDDKSVEADLEKSE